MSDARTEVLDRIRRALADVPASEQPDDVPVARDYRRAGELQRPDVLDLFEERVSDYRASVRRVAADRISAAVDEACAQMGLGRIVVPPELPADWRPTAVELVEDDGLAPRELDRLGVLTGCAAAIAQTGTILLDGQSLSGRRALTLVPDHHICVVTAEQVVELVPEGLERVSGRQTPVTLISGPSASSDIELERVEGVHGPRHLVVLLVEP
jgi:L-lactate dehydrogenase complex protein LldG